MRISPYGTESILAEPLTCFQLTGTEIQALIQAGVPDTITTLALVPFCTEYVFLRSVENVLGTSDYHYLILNHITYIGTRGTYQEWMFGSVRHFGHPSQGTWRLEVSDRNNQPVENVEWKLQLYGTEIPDISEPFAWRITTPTESSGGFDVTHGGIVCTFDEDAFFTLTDSAFETIREAGEVPSDVVNRVASLQDQAFATEHDLLDAVHDLIGAEVEAPDRGRYVSLIVDQAETSRGRLRLYPKDYALETADARYVMVDSTADEDRTHTGTYQAPL